MRMGMRKNVLFIYTVLILSVSCNVNDAIMDTLYENIVHAQEILKDVASNINIGLKSVGQTVKFLEKFVDSTIEEDCNFICPNNFLPVADPHYLPQTNGCGSFGFHLDGEDLPKYEMVECCDEHDRCYGTCGSDKEDCDKKFKRCLYQSCDLDKDVNNALKHKMCKGGAKLLYTATMALGCTSFKDAQNEACLCKPKADFSKKNYRNEDL